MATIRRVAENTWWDRAEDVLPGGVSSNTRLLGPPLVIQRGQGAWVWDAAGNDYIDCLLGQGPAFLGHGSEKIRSAVLEATKDGILFAATHPREVEAAERLRDALSWPEMVRFGSSSTEMVQAALRLARAGTGRRQFVVFEGHYHGWLDNINMARTDGEAVPVSAGQPPEALSDAILIDWNEPMALRQVFADHGDQIAAVIMEPAMVNAGLIAPRPGYLDLARELTEKHGSVLVFDETITGFRLALGGAIERFGVTPDIAIYGKALAAGWPAAAIVGKESLMSKFGTGEVGHFGTFNGNMVAASAILAGLDALTTGDPYADLTRQGERLMAGLRTLADDNDVPVHIQGFPMAFHMSMPRRDRDMETFRELQATDKGLYGTLWERFLHHGIWIAKRGIWYVSMAHNDDVIDELLDRASDTFKAQGTQRLAMAVGR